MKLPVPVICKCGFNTMDAKRAVEHECCESCIYKETCEITGDIVHWCKAYTIGEVDG